MDLKIVYVEISKTSIREIVVNSQADADRDGVYGALLLEGGAPTRTTDPVLTDDDLATALANESQQFQNASTAKLTNLYYFKSANMLYINRAHALKARDTNLRSSYLIHPECLFLVPLSFNQTAGNGFVEFTDIDGDKINLSYTYPNYTYPFSNVRYGSLAYQDDNSGFDLNDKSNVFEIKENPTNSESSNRFMLARTTKSTDFSSTGRFFCGRPVTLISQFNNGSVSSRTFGDVRGCPFTFAGKDFQAPYIFGTSFPKGVKNSNYIANYIRGGGFGYAEGFIFSLQPKIIRSGGSLSGYQISSFSSDIQFVQFDSNKEDLFDLNTISPNTSVIPFVYIIHNGQVFDAGNGSSFRFSDNLETIFYYTNTNAVINSLDTQSIVWESDIRPLQNSKFSLPQGTEVMVLVSGTKQNGEYFARYTKVEGSKYNLYFTKASSQKGNTVVRSTNGAAGSIISSYESFSLRGKTERSGNQVNSIQFPKVQILNDVNLNVLQVSLVVGYNKSNNFVLGSSLNQLNIPSSRGNGGIISSYSIEGRVGLFFSPSASGKKNPLTNNIGNSVSVANTVNDPSLQTSIDLDENSYFARGDIDKGFDYLWAAYARNTLNPNNNQTS